VNSEPFDGDSGCCSYLHAIGQGKEEEEEEEAWMPGVCHHFLYSMRSHNALLSLPLT
jgi:hypothetical protein